MRRLLHRHVLLPAFESLYKRRESFGYLRELERTQWLSRRDLDALQMRSLQNLLRHAWENCPYYRAAWEAQGLDPQRIDSLDDLRRLPVIDRSTIAEHRTEMRAKGMRLMSKSTGGSSGVPLHFDLDDDSHDRRWAASNRGYAWAGADLGKKMLYLWGVPLGKQSRGKRWKDALYYGLYRRQILNCFALSEERVPEYLEAHNRYRADVLVAYTNALYEFARFLEQRNAKPYSPKSIIVGAEKLHGFQRDLIERVFGAPVFETYGSREFMLIGAECDRHDGLHLSHENMIVEVLADDGLPTAEGCEGNIVVTDLFNFGMPFIRYLNGDRATAGLSSCTCGRGLPVLKKIVGRRLDVLNTPDGRSVPGEFFPHLMKDFASVKRFQVVQDEADHVELRVVAGAGWDERARQAIEEASVDVLGPACRFDIVRVEDIPLTAMGKLKVVENRCPRTLELASV